MTKEEERDIEGQRIDALLKEEFERRGWYRYVLVDGIRVRSLLGPNQPLDADGPYGD
jgi:hypothetical protein